MKRWKHNFKKGMAWVLSIAMVTGLVPAMSGGANTVQAADSTVGNAGKEPSVSAYATKEQMMGDTFAPNSDGVATNYGKLVFGTNSSDNPQEWYILGKDEGVSWDNTIIFAASPIATGKAFNSIAGIKTETSLWSDCNYGEASVTEVYANHYGASDLRDTLQKMAVNLSYFTTAEQGLMIATTVTTKDMKNGVTYTTTDKLYALQGVFNNNKYLWAGTDDSTVLAMSSYWSSGELLFWLRSPYNSGSAALRAYPGHNVNGNDVYYERAVQPASNLNLSSVLFASAATAASSETVEARTIADGTAMTLRLDGTGKNIGTVTYNTTTGDIKAAKDTTSQSVALVVQGNDGTDDWFYSKTIATSETINTSTIKSALALSSDIDLSACKIWLEITDTDEMIYAVNAEKEIESINTTYVTKEQLMTAFTPDANGTATTKGKLVFGKNSSGNVQEWYILGKDTGVSGDNTIIFAASPIATGQEFSSSSDNKTYGYGAGTGYGESEGSIEVYPNHYGASELRRALQNMAADTSYFTTAEQNLMNDTTVTTKDTKNNVNYTTTDKLYALAADGSGYKTIKAGNNNTILAMSSYWSDLSGDWFRLRSPYDTSSTSALVAGMGSGVIGGVNVRTGVTDLQPASNLNLSSVLFASAATAASSDTAESDTIADGTAMTLRLDGTGKNIGTVEYSATTGDIKAVKGATSQTVALVVQGNNGINDWYYSKQITGTETINVSNIESKSGTPDSIDLSICKIWLEITDRTENLTYAVNATEDTIPLFVKTPNGNHITLEVKKNATISTVKEKIYEKEGISVDEQQLWFAGRMLEDDNTLQDYSISKDSTLILTYIVKNVNVTINTPKGGQVLDTNVTCSMNEIKSATLEWTDTDNNPVSGKANYYPWCYKAHVTLMPNDGYAVTDATEVHINNNATEEKTINTDGSITVTCCFYSNQDKLTGITAPSPITTGNGAEKTVAGLGLPSQVDITTVEGAASKADVVWDLENLASGTYNPSFLTEQIFTVNGTVTLPEEVGNTDNISLNITIQVTVSAAGIVGVPTANPTATTYTENQSVTLTSSTEGATIYYTIDGSDPTITDGTPAENTKQYTAPIAVTGTEGQSITTTIKAIAVKDRMQNSIVETFTYTIQIPVPKYAVTVTNGSGTGQYTQGETVTITANAAPSGQQFKEWEVISGTITLTDSTSETTTFTMPAEAVSVKANYEVIPVTEYTITSTAGANGSITPSGAVSVAEGGSQTFTISPSSGYVIDTLKVDGLEVTATTSYTFSDVNANHTIEVTFKQESQTPAVTAPSITTQPGNATVNVGETATFTIAAGGTDLTYQWQIDRNDGNGWVNIAGATATSYTTSTVDISCRGFKYRCAVSNSAGTVTSNTVVLTVTENTNPAPNPVDYKILDGANSDWKQNTDGTITIRGNGDFAKFVGVKVDGSTIDAKNYTAKEGSTIITLTADYLKTLSVGTHTFEILWTDGSATTSFTVSKNDSGSETPKDDDGDKDNNDKPNDNSNNNPATVPDDKNKDISGSQTGDNQQITAPKTGDNNHLVMWVTLLGVSLAGLLSLLYTRKKKDNE